MMKTDEKKFEGMELPENELDGVTGGRVMVKSEHVNSLSENAGRPNAPWNAAPGPNVLHVVTETDK